MPIELQADQLDLAGLVRPGDSVFWGQGTAEPLTLSEALVAQRAAIGKARIFLGVSYSETLQAVHADHLSFSSYGGMGANQRLARAGLLDILPCHYSQLPQLIASGALRCDVVFMQLSAADAKGRHSLGVANDYLLEAARRARVVIAEVNEQAPWTYGSEDLAGIRLDFVVRSARPLLELAAQPGGEIERRIATAAAQFIGDGAVLETGIGAIPDAILAALADRRHLGLHSGMIGDGALDLIEAGAVDNSSKAIDRGISTTGVLFGSSRLFRYAHRNAAIALRPSTYTHSAQVLAQLDNFIAINSAIEVDLSGQVNAELAGDNYIGAIGGQVDFVRAANASRGGRSIIALPSTAQAGKASRIVSRLAGGVTTSLRADADVVVTEWGAAELRGLTLAQRTRRMIAIAHPDFREGLEREAGARRRDA